MGHIGEKYIHAMQCKGMVENFPDFYFEVAFCEHCVYGKQNLVRLPFKATRDNGILKLVHNDVFGLVLVPSWGGFVDYVSFIDDFPRKKIVVLYEEETWGFWEVIRV